ncbi:hypothetical protein GQR58_029891 [Nymphon striatum]|nr:hypothetical protein GQR58_029891 [Nymphon striatum]
MFIIQSLPTSLPHNFGKVAELVLKIICSTQADETHFVYDSYVKSIKNAEQQARGANDGSFNITGADQLRPKDFRYALRSPNFKTALIKFFMEEWKRNKYAAIIKRKTAVVAHENQCIQYTATQTGNVEHNEGSLMTRIIKDKAAVQALVTMLESNWINPFDENSQELVSISTGKLATPDITENLLHAHELGKKAYDAFKTGRLEQEPPARTHGKELVLKADRNLFAQMLLVAQSRKLKIKDVLSHPLGPLPMALANPDGMMRTTNKSSLGYELQNYVYPAANIPQPCCCIIDGMVPVQKMRASEASPGQNVVVRATDTDIMVILLYHARQLNANMWMDLGHSADNTRRYAHITTLANHIDPVLCKALPGYHALTGCDYTSSFFRKGKVNPLKKAEKSPLHLEGLGRLGENITFVDDDDLVERYVCSLYGHGTLPSVNAARLKMFLQKYKPTNHDSPLEQIKGIYAGILPPCKDVLVQKLARCNYVAYLWKHENLRDPLENIQPTDHGWKETIAPEDVADGDEDGEDNDSINDADSDDNDDSDDEDEND